MRCISRFIRPRKLIRQKCKNRPKYHRFKNLVLIAEEEKIIQKNSSVINVYTFSHADFKGVQFYSARKYAHVTKEVI